MPCPQHTALVLPNHSVPGKNQLHLGDLSEHAHIGSGGGPEPSALVSSGRAGFLGARAEGRQAQGCRLCAAGSRWPLISAIEPFPKLIGTALCNGSDAWVPPGRLSRIAPGLRALPEAIRPVSITRGCVEAASQSSVRLVAHADEAPVPRQLRTCGPSYARSPKITKRGAPRQDYFPTPCRLVCAGA
jgi:hypothetical protein